MKVATNRLLTLLYSYRIFFLPVLGEFAAYAYGVFNETPVMSQRINSKSPQKKETGEKA